MGSNQAPNNIIVRKLICRTMKKEFISHLGIDLSLPARRAIVFYNWTIKVRNCRSFGSSSWRENPTIQEPVEVFRKE
jgi:hypothetical protein